MGSLKPNTVYIYERVDDTIYAREEGADPLTRVPIGRDFDANVNISLRDWYDLLDKSNTNTTLQDAVAKCIMIYRLTKEE